MAETQKVPAEYDYQQTLRRIYNAEGSTMSVDGFLAGKVGRKIRQTKTTTNTLNDTLVFDFIEDGTALYQFTLVFNNSSFDELIEATRTA